MPIESEHLKNKLLAIHSRVGDLVSSAEKLFPDESVTTPIGEGFRFHFPWDAAFCLDRISDTATVGFEPNFLENMLGLPGSGYWDWEIGRRRVTLAITQNTQEDLSAKLVIDRHSGFTNHRIDYMHLPEEYRGTRLLLWRLEHTLRQKPDSVSRLMIPYGAREAMLPWVYRDSKNLAANFITTRPALPPLFRSV